MLWCTRAPGSRTGRLVRALLGNSTRETWPLPPRRQLQEATHQAQVLLQSPCLALAPVPAGTVVAAAVLVLVATAQLLLGASQ